MKYLFLSVVIIFVLKSTLSDIIRYQISILSDDIATPPFLGILFVWYIVFHPRTFNLCLYTGWDNSRITVLSFTFEYNNIIY